MHTTEQDTQDQDSEADRPDNLDEVILGEARRLLDRACTGDQRDRGQAAVMTDELLDRARRALQDRGLTPPCYARVLRASALVRNMAQLPELPPDPLVHDLIAHTVRHGLAAHNAAAQALRGTLAISRNSVDEALYATVDAMATIELVAEHSVERALAMSDTASLLDQLAMPEQASDLYGQAAAEFEVIGMRGYYIMTTGNQVRTELLHGLWLERIGQPAAGAERFANAAKLAETMLRLWRESDLQPALDEEFIGDFRAAIALADPHGPHEEDLRQATTRIALPGQVVATLALVRRLAATGRRSEADIRLAQLRVDCRRFQLPLPLRMALSRGALELPRHGEQSVETTRYLNGLEDELWRMRKSRAQALYARLEYERLRRYRTPMPALTTTDPVTRLPDRGVLDGLLATLDDSTQPSVLAMVDIDGLMDINERSSYADGDAVLRAVAVTVRGHVRPQDSVLRYSADEFVVIMPGHTLQDAAEILRRVVTAVAELPHGRGRGATISIGAVAVEPGEGGESALVRADDATMAAKNGGGNQVVAVANTPSPR